MKKNKFIVFFFSALLLTGCASNKLIEIGENSDCETSIEGNYYAPQVYKHYGPAVVFPPKHELRYQAGEVIQYDSNGVLFLKKKGGVLGNRDTVFFRYDEISAVVDSQKFCVWGKLAERDITKMELTFSLRNLDDSTYQPLEIILNKDKHFAFCAKPGKYELSSIKMTKADEDRDYYFLSIYSPLGSFEIKSGKANYIGEITVLTYDTTNNISFRVPYKKYSKQGTYIPYYSGVSPAATIIGTAVAVAIYAAIELNKTPETNLPELKFHVEHSPLFQSFSKSNIENTLLLIPE